jgi:hypothetical protein
VPLWGGSNRIEFPEALNFQRIKDWRLLFSHRFAGALERGERPRGISKLTKFDSYVYKVNRCSRVASVWAITSVKPMWLALLREYSSGICGVDDCCGAPENLSLSGRAPLF